MSARSNDLVMPLINHIAIVVQLWWEEYFHFSSVRHPQPLKATQELARDLTTILGVKETDDYNEWMLMMIYGRVLSNFEMDQESQWRWRCNSIHK